MLFRSGGDGLFLRLLRERGFRQLKLLDISPVAVQKAREKGFDVEVQDITKPLRFADNTFGTVCALDILEHLYDPLPLLNEMARVGEDLVVVVPNFHYWKERYHMLIGKVPFQCKPKRGHVHWFNWVILQEMIGQAGLQVDGVLFGGFTRLGPVGSCLARMHPKLFATGFAVRLVGREQ